MRNATVTIRTKYMHSARASEATRGSSEALPTYQVNKRKITGHQFLFLTILLWFVWLGGSNARMRQITRYHAAIAGEKYGGGGNRL
jgi:hypothetical protein